jgi:hypothetical protein
MTDTTHNGWRNYATWRVKHEIIDRMDFGRLTFEDVGALADFLREVVDEALTNFGEIKKGLALDYARSFVADCDYHEIAQHYADANEGLIRADDDDDEDEAA